MIPFRGWALLGLLLLPLCLWAAPPTREQKEAMAKMPGKYRAWMEEVDALFTDEERAAFLALEKDYQRDAFIEKFWQSRDPLPRTARNELRERWDVGVRQAREMFGDLKDGRARTLLLNGPPAERLESGCPQILWPVEAWFYSFRSERVEEPFIVILYRRWGAGPFRIWNPNEGLDVLFVDGNVRDTGPTKEQMAETGVQKHSLSELTNVMDVCKEDLHARKLAGAIGWVASQGLRWHLLESRIDSAPDAPGAEWVSAFSSYSTDLPEGAAALPAKLEVSFPGRRQSR
ncbi:MAG TPA: GWxTD domain-containing protein, partial [Thermoanaerobaculia bacterium]